MSWFRKEEPPKTSFEKESAEIRDSLRNRKVPDPVAAMFLDEYLHARHKVKKVDHVEPFDMPQYIDTFESARLLMTAYYSRDRE